ncbi:hypothetical protein [Paludibacter sp.]|uniref:hypothetical protein n=1 Tax=Paludibacter sp. TaxID=1898105 RepID=UPI0025DBE3BA|nr:hypothetical protein [Paludibacter sp.]
MPSFGTGDNSSQGGFYYVGNNPRVYPGQEAALQRQYAGVAAQTQAMIAQYGSISASQSNGWEKFRDDNIVSRIAYNVLDGFYVWGTNLSSGGSRHLSGVSANDNELRDAGVNSILMVAPFMGGMTRGMMATETSTESGLNLFKWGVEQTGESTGWKAGDYMLHLPDKGTPKLNWNANYSALRYEMNLGNPIFDSYRLPNGDLIPTGGFLNAERFTLQTRGWVYNPNMGAWMPPF